MNKLDRNNYLLKSSHFTELIIIKSSGYPIPLKCSWFFDVRLNKINEKNFNCIGYKEDNQIFSFDYEGNFMFSSKFEEFFKDEKKNNTLYSLIGKCKLTN